MRLQCVRILSRSPGGIAHLARNAMAICIIFIIIIIMISHHLPGELLLLSLSLLLCKIPRDNAGGQKNKTLVAQVVKNVVGLWPERERERLSGRRRCRW